MGKEKILAVDDTLLIRTMVKDILEKKGYEVITACDGEEALEKVYNEEPDLIVLDLQMPKVDGFEVCQELKFDPEYQDIPIIMLTARVEDINKMEGLGIGADDYITKPVDAKKLIKAVREVLKLKL